jgi:hypothetical protein
MKYKIILIALFFLNILSAQTNIAKDSLSPFVEAEIKIIARVQKDKILLRWAVTEPTAWLKLNQFGYHLIRYTVTRNNKTLEEPIKKDLGIIKPNPLETWESLSETNDNASIVAQALYGETFSVSGASNFKDIINLSAENEQRFTFSLFACENDFEVATKAGLGYTDTEVLPNEKYSYQIMPMVPPEVYPIKGNGIFTGLAEYESLPKPIDFSVFFTDNASMLSWNYKILQVVYSSYHIERSVDKINFERLTNKPYASMNQENESNTRIFYVDSITNNKKYYYRIQGVSSFGELGPYSDIASGEGKTILKYVPHLTVKEFKDENTVTLTWEFPIEGEDEITGFELNRADQDDQKYTTVVKKIAPKVRSVVYNKLLPTNYFTITALGKGGNNRTSGSMIVQPVDSIPPVKPVNLKGKIDSLGVVKISWSPNKEKDLLGYRIYRANNPKEEFKQLTVSPYPNAFYQDTVVLKSLNDKVYYKVIAVDYRYNMSDYSEVLMVKKPDVVPPTAPVFSKYDIQDDGVYLEWINSSSTDVATNLLYRQEVGQEDWQLLLEDKKLVTNYKDNTTIEGHAYRYAIFAKDESQLKSAPSPNLGIKIPRASVSEGVKGFYAMADPKQKTVQLSWNYKLIGVKHFELYKGTDKDPIQLMQEITADARQFTDPTVIINTEYQYGIRAIFTDGRASKMVFFKLKY